MAGLLMAMISVAAAFWMYLDATKHGIGKNPSKASFWTLSAGGWAAWGILFWPLGLPVYLIRRSTLIERAKQVPCVPKNKNRSLILLGIAGAALIGFNLNAQGADSSGWASSADVFLDRWNSQAAPAYKIDEFQKDSTGKTAGNFLAGTVYAVSGGEMYMLVTHDQSLFGSLCSQTIEASLNVEPDVAEALSRQAYNSLQTSSMAFGMVKYKGSVVSMGVSGAAELDCTVTLHAAN